MCQYHISYNRRSPAMSVQGFRDMWLLQLKSSPARSRRIIINLDLIMGNKSNARTLFRISIDMCILNNTRTNNVLDLPPKDPFVGI